MSLVRVAARLPLRTCLQTCNAACQRQVQKQDTFEGVFNAYFWDEQTGFGETGNGKRVLISSEYITNSDLFRSTEGQLWQDIIEPTTLLDHNALRDELQMSVLSYDIDLLSQDQGETSTQSVPIFRGSVESTTFTNDVPPSGETAGFSGGNQTAAA